MIKYSKLSGIPTKFNYSKLLGRVIEYFGTQAVFAAAMGLSERSISLKLNNIRRWTQIEIFVACEILRIPHNEISAYFFTVDAQD